MAAERRKYTRYKIGNAVSIIPEGVYQVTDISEGGFCFKCQSHIPIPEKLMTDIINSVIPLEEIQARKIWVSLHENAIFNIPCLIKVGAKFGKLRKEQKQKLEKLIESLSTNID